MVLQHSALARQPGEICTMTGGSSMLPAATGFSVPCIAGIWHSLVAPCQGLLLVSGLQCHFGDVRNTFPLPRLLEGKEGGVQHTAGQRSGQLRHRLNKHG